MTVEEVIKELSKHPPKHEVMIEDVDGYASDLEEVSVEDYTKTVILKPY